MLVRRRRVRRYALALSTAAVFVAVAQAALWAPAPAAQSRSCGTYASASIYARAEVIAIRGVGCRRALRVAKRYDRKGRAPSPWHCFLGHRGRRLFSCGHPPPPGGGPITRARHALLARGLGSPNSSSDQKPAFGGLRSATTCLPGPVGPPRSSPYSLRWNAATDDRTPQDQIVYDIYRASQSSGEDFSAPTYTSARGATSFTTPSLSSAESWYFVVRARDRVGNRDSNRLERLGENLCV